MVGKWRGGFRQGWRKPATYPRRRVGREAVVGSGGQQDVVHGYPQLPRIVARNRQATC